MSATPAGQPKRVRLRVVEPSWPPCDTSASALEIALVYIARDWSPVPIAYRKKGPTIEGWQRLRITAEEAPRWFNSRRQNIGVILRPDELGDVDLDTAEACAVAPYFLPAPTSIFGRSGKRSSHWLYVVEGVPPGTKATLSFDDPTRKGKGARLVELRVGGGDKGAQTVFPGSTHEDTGEPINWEVDREPLTIDFADIYGCVCRLAAAALLQRHWPPDGLHHDAANALGGALRRSGWEVPEIKLLIEAVAGPKHASSAAYTAKAVDEGRNAYGIPKLVELFGSPVIDKVSEWLGLHERVADSGSSTPGGRTGAATTAGAPDPHASPAPEEPWPEMAPAAFHGLAGEVVQAIAPHSETDPVAILLQFLTMFGTCCGRFSYAMAEADRHPPRIWPVLVGTTSRGRKGTSWGHIRALFERVQTPEWMADHYAGGGLSSGEGIIDLVRDPRRGIDKKTKEEIETDAGVKDKRLIVVEAEFASVLHQFEREGNTLSATLRNLWDRGDVRSITRSSPVKATGAHVSVLGHITQDELTRYLTRTELANGFANRLLFACVRRSKLLPFGGSLDDDVRSHLVAEIQERLADIGEADDREVCFVPQAAHLWKAGYGALSVDRPGIYGAVTARAEAQVLRLSLIYALLEPPGLLGTHALITPKHLEAALAVWAYCDASAAYIFGKALGDPIADAVYQALRGAPNGMTRGDFYNYFGHRGSTTTARALALLLRHGLVRSELNPTGGRPEERWYAV